MRSAEHRAGLTAAREETTGMLSLSQASEIVDEALRKARELELRSLTVTVLDPGGHPVVVKREDGAGILRPQIAHAKAWGCLGTGQGGAAGARHAARDPAFFAALAAISDGRVASSRGGVLIRDAEGTLLGAIGVSGDRPENDEMVAVAGVEKAGLVADAGARGV
jgi:uncharacterized protein GlcG (DUF336 family)